MDIKKPAIWTTKGNLNTEDLIRSFGWEFSHTTITYWERYTLNDEEVRKDVSVFSLPEGSTFNIEQGSFS